MKLSTIEFNGYKRLCDTKCNVDGHVIAFVGPNEVGKSSVLKGLEWLTAPDAQELSTRDISRRMTPSESSLVVRAHYRLDEEDFLALDELDVDARPAIGPKTVTGFRLSRRLDGSTVTGLDASVRRNEVPFQLASTKLRRVERARVKATKWLNESEILDHELLVQRALSEIDPAESTWTPDRRARAENSLVELELLHAELKGKELSVTEVQELIQVLAIGIESYREAVRAGSLGNPEDEVHRLLRKRVPRFVLFSDSDREISEAYYLADENIRQFPPAPLVNLLAVAGSNVDQVWGIVEGGDSARLRTLERRMNATLKTRLQPMWSQSDLTINLTLNQGGYLEVNVDEINSADFTVTPIAERSDGLRAFFGLVCFLIAFDLEIPPVLMIDEAERNLHYDAQGDLMRVLTKDLKVHKVLYTTHSPGCLPLDLGTGIRVVKRDPNDPGVSKLENNFWISSDPGFSRLLFAMGAEAAAFSAFRRAILAEGVSEMILLPTLLRNAPGGSELDFQVAFGLSNMSVPQAIHDVALITTFLVDGDEAGRSKKDKLLEAGVPTSHIFQLPHELAIEDLVDRSVYLEVVNGFLDEQGKSIRPEDLAVGVNIARAVDDYARSHLGLPNGVSHKIIASRLAELGSGLQLSSSGKTYLPQLRSGLRTAFDNPYTL